MFNCNSLILTKKIIRIFCSECKQQNILFPLHSVQCQITRADNEGIWYSYNGMLFICAHPSPLMFCVSSVATVVIYWYHACLLEWLNVRAELWRYTVTFSKENFLRKKVYIYVQNSHTLRLFQKFYFNSNMLFFVWKWFHYTIFCFNAVNFLPEKDYVRTVLSNRIFHF